MLSFEELNPFKILEIPSGSSKGVARKKFIEHMRNLDKKLQPYLCLAFDMICRPKEYNISNDIYRPKKKDEYYYCNIGDLKKLKELIYSKKNKGILIQKDSLERTLLYISSRNGYYDIVEFLIKLGADINARQKTGSTPLHGAAFYGHESIVKLLLENGCDPKIKNNYINGGNTAAEEANKTSIKTIISNSYSDQILDLYHRLYSQGYVTNFVPIKNDEDEVICYKMICKSMFHHNLKGNAVIWHGTKFKNLESIVKNGLKPSGTKISDKSIIMPPDNHIDLNTTFEGIKDWAKAVFVSPSCFYSSHPAYAERILSNGKKWACLVEGRVKNGCFTRHHSTTDIRKNVPYNEPPCVEFRIENQLNLFVTSVVFISMDFINGASYYNEQDAITETSQERMLTEESYWSENI